MSIPKWHSMELRFLSCVCVYSQEKMCPVHLFHRVYLVLKKLSCANIYMYFFLPARKYKAQSGLAIKKEIYIG